MKLVTFEYEGALRLGVMASDTEVFDVDVALEALSVERRFGDMLGLIKVGKSGLDQVAEILRRAPRQALRSLANVRLRAPIPQPPRLRDTLMFLEHMESGLRQWARNLAKSEADPALKFDELMASGRYSLHPVFKQQVIYYNADHLAISGPDDVIKWPAASSYADFELEWAIVIGSAKRGMSATEANSAIFGYTIFNDWSARDLQAEFMQANLGPSGGKDFADGNSFGPCIVTPDEIPNPYSLTMEARVNGELWSQGSTGSMHHKFEDAIAQFSRFEDLVPGEIIGSGTVLRGCGYELGRKLSSGDVVELRVEGIGTLRNRVWFEANRHAGT